MKPPPGRLALATYPFATSLEPRFGDMDSLRHLNNVALAGLYEEARLRFTRRFGHEPEGSGDAQRPMLAEVAIRYLAQGRYPGTLTVGVGTLRLGRTSYVIGQAMFQEGRCIGTADVVVVWTAAGRPHPLPEPFRGALAAGSLVGPNAEAARIEA